MLTMNIFTELGLCNGALGTLVNFVYTNGQQPPCLPMCDNSILHLQDVYQFVPLLKFHKLQSTLLKDISYH